MNKYIFLARAYAATLDPDVQMRLDSVGGSTAFARQFEFIEQELVKTVFAPLKSEELIPYDTSYPAGITSVTHRTVTETGQADFVNHYADDLPNVDVFTQETEVKVEPIGVQYFFSTLDLQRAALDSTFRLDSARKESAINAMRRKHDEIAAIGSTRYGRTGFINSAAVPLVTPITGTWSGATSDQIVADIAKLWNSIPVANLDTDRPDTLVLDIASHQLISTKAYGTNSDKTILQYLKDNFDGLKTVERWSRLATAGAGSTKRAIAYKKDKSVAKYIVPEVFAEEPPQRKSLKVVTPCHAQTGFTDVRKPLAIAYMDGV
jgi:hypothetical protein